MKEGKLVQRQFFIEPRKVEAADLSRCALASTRDRNRRTEARSRARLARCALIEKYRRADGSSVAELRAGGPKGNRILNQALEIRKAKGRPAAAEFIRMSIRRRHPQMRLVGATAGSARSEPGKVSEGLHALAWRHHRIRVHC
jgi:hypothetical protein